MRITRKFLHKKGVIYLIILIISLTLLGCNIQTSTKSKNFINEADKYIEALNKVSTEQKAHGNILVAKDLYLLDRGLDREKILSRKSIEMMYENEYGWGVGELNGSMWVGHNGLLNNGYSSTLLRFPEEDLVVIALLNVSNQDNLNFNIAQALSLMALDEEIVLPIKKERISLSRYDLERFEGEYEFENRYKISVDSNGNYLTFEPSMRRIKFFPYSSKSFYAEGVEYRTIEFTSNANGDINGLIFRECVVELKGKKLK